MLVSLSLESGLTFFLSRKEINEKELITISLVWSLLASIGAALILFFLRDNHFSSSKYNTAGFSFLFIAGTLLTTFFSALFYARRQFLFPHLVPAIMNFGVLLFYVGLAVSGKKNDTGLLVIVFFTSFLANGILLCLLYHNKYSLRFSLGRISKTAFLKLTKYSGLAFITNIIAFFAYRIDYWILKSFSPQTITETALGNYIQVTKLVQLFLFAPTVVATIVFPISAAGDDPGFRKNFKTMIGQLILLNTAACVIILLIGQWLFGFLYGETFSLMYRCFIYSIGAILSITVVRVLSSYFAGTNRIRYNLAGSLIALIVITILNFLLIPLMGINGAALADSAGYFAYMALLLILFRKEREAAI